MVLIACETSAQREGGRRSVDVRAVVVGALAVFVLYVAAINVFLSTSLFARVVDAEPDTVDIDFDVDGSIVPRTHPREELSIRGATQRGVDPAPRWVEFQVSFLALVPTALRDRGVHERGLSFRLATAPSTPARPRPKRSRGYRRSRTPAVLGPATQGGVAGRDDPTPSTT